MKHTIVVLAVAIACVSPTVSSQQTAVPTFRSGRDILTLEASVRDATGRPVTDLEPSDFTVTIDGQPRRVVNARMFGSEADRVVKAGTPVPRFAKVTDSPAGRVVLFAVDRDSIRSGSEKAILETSATMMSSLSPADAVGVIGLPVGGIDPTRDHAAAVAAIRSMTGTRPANPWLYSLSWEEVVAYEHTVQDTITGVIERECSPSDRRCPGDLANQAREMLFTGRTQVQITLSRLGDLLDGLATFRAPKHLVLFSAGLPFDMELMSWYTVLATKAARARVSIFVVHIDQQNFDASVRRNVAGVSGREYTTGLGNIAASTGGVFVNGVGTAAGALTRIVSDINYFYQLGVESQPSDSDGKTHRVKIEVRRPNLKVRAPAEIATPLAAKSPAGDAVTAALAQPTDISEVPLEVATYATHAEASDKVRVVVSATVPEAAGFVPAEWGYVVINGGKVVGGSHEQIVPELRERWSGTSAIVVAAGTYRIRTAVVALDGRIATLDLPLVAGLRAAGGVTASDLMVGVSDESRLVPRARLTRGDTGIAMLELSSNEPLTATTGAVELTRAGTTQPALRGDMVLGARANDKTIVIAQARLDLSRLEPGTYMASAVLSRAGQPFARVSRLVDVVPGEATATAVSAAAATASGVPARRDPELAAVLQRVGQYVEGYGEQASLIIATEHYEQRFKDPPLGQPSERKLVADVALFKSNDATGWIGFRDVIAVNGKPVSDRMDRLQALLGGGTPDVAAARRIADESARYNIGFTRRNFNEPTSALFFFRPASQRRFAFTAKGTTKIDGVTAFEIAFRETATPTIIRTSEGRDVACSGTIWVVPQDGTVLRTSLFVGGFGGPNTSAKIDVTFARDARLGLWLPMKMTEQHEGARLVGQDRGRTSLQRGVVTATATYDNFKRFETSTSISIK